MAASQRLRFEDCELDLTRNCLLRKGREVHLRQKAFLVLQQLIEGRGRLVTKDELFGQVWPETAVTDDVLVQVIRELRRALGDDSHQPVYIKTVPKEGYRFICEVTEADGQPLPEDIIKVEFEIEEETQTESQAQSSGLLDLLTSAGMTWRVAAGSVAAIVVLAGAFYIIAPTIGRSSAEVRLPSVAGKKALAVMFFDNRSGDTELDWLREGLPDMILTKLSRSNKVMTLSRAQLQAVLKREGYKDGSAIEQEAATAVARRAGVNTLVMGDFSRLGETIRVNATLIDAESGDLEAAESITVGSPGELLDRIDILALMLVKALDADQANVDVAIATAMTDDIEAYRCYSLAIEKAHGLNNPEAVKLLEKAIELDPEFAMAHARLGYTYAVTWGLAEKARPYLAKAFARSDKLSAKDRLHVLAWYSIANLDYPRAVDHFRQIIIEYPLETEAYLRLGNLLRGERQHAEAIDVLKRGLVVEPDSPILHNTLGLIYSERGKHDEAIESHRRYVSLAPTEANSYDSLGMSFHWAGRYDEAIDSYSKALELNPKFEIAYSHIGVAYFQTGRYKKAEEYFRRYLELAPSDLEKGRAYCYLARIFRARGDKSNELAFAKKAYDLGGQFGVDMLSYMLEKGDRRAVADIGSKVFLPIKVSNRGSRVSERPQEYFKGMVAMADGDHERALTHFRSALQHNPYTWDIEPYEDCLGRAYLRLGRYSEAIAEFQRVLQINPNYPLANYHIGEAYRRSGADAEAAAKFDDFLSTWKDADVDIPEVGYAARFLSEIRGRG